jgi:hypothetical protein
MSPQWLARKEPCVLSQPIGHDKVPMFFWGPFSGPGAARKVASLRDPEGLFASQPSIFTFSFIGLDPDGCLVADRIRIRTKNIENSGAGNEKGLIRTG